MRSIYENTSALRTFSLITDVIIVVVILASIVAAIISFVTENYIAIGQKVRRNKQIISNLAKAYVFMADKDPQNDVREQWLTKAILCDNTNCQARVELAYIHMEKGDYHSAFVLFDKVQVYRKAIECLDQIDDNFMKAQFYAKKGLSEKALEWLYEHREITLATTSFARTNEEYLKVQEMIDKLLDDPK